jgi:hypothetical protein
MNRNDNQRDLLAERLHREGLAERPPFSPQLHRRIMLRAQAPSRPDFRRWLVAAAALLAVTTWTVHRFMRPILPITIVQYTQRSNAEIASAAPDDNLSVNFAGLVSAGLFPPEIRISVPVASDSAEPEPADQSPAPSTATPGSPDWVMASLPDPATSAVSALVDVMPPNFQLALDLFDH